MINYFRQCTLEKRIPDGTIRIVSWIPEKYATKDEFLKLKNGEWDDGWKVTRVGESRSTEKEVLARERDFTKHREATDI